MQYFAEKPIKIESPEDEMYKKMVDHFMAGPNDNFRKNRLKLIPNVVEGPWMIKQAANVPALIGKKLTSTFRRGATLALHCLYNHDKPAQTLTSLSNR